jgi:CopG family nickel-responsive transcriptional regulator
MREAVEARRVEKHESKYCVANLSYVFNHHERTLAERLTEAQHAHHDLVVSSTHIHLDHENCLESVMLKGRTDAVTAFADQVRAERGVRFGSLNLVSVSTGDEHPARASHSHKGHVHLSPQRG